jgi:hypothetical protein
LFEAAKRNKYRSHGSTWKHVIPNASTRFVTSHQSSRMECFLSRQDSTLRVPLSNTDQTTPNHLWEVVPSDLRIINRYICTKHNETRSESLPLRLSVESQLPYRSLQHFESTPRRQHPSKNNEGTSETKYSSWQEPSAPRVVCCCKNVPIIPMFAFQVSTRGGGLGQARGKQARDGRLPACSIGWWEYYSGSFCSAY